MSDYSDVTVIVPTLNEGGNITKLINILTKGYPRISVIVSDDGSKDGTAEAVLKIGKKNKRIRLLDRKREGVHGLTASVIDAALIVNTDKIVVMDGDLQHPADKIKEITRKLDDYNIVVGVRTAVENWGIHRIIISKGMAYIAYGTFVLRGRPVSNDIMSGFFGINANLFKNIIRKNRDSFVPTGYKVLLDTLRLVGRRCKVGEVYYSTFREREYGQSKLKMKHMANALSSTFR
ncbi:MAG TPA: glycosyltransferase [Candidatus Acidoferrales bacterium]|nr:glycosyltransferase [Candidatus Acidoferrales bacterium]